MKRFSISAFAGDESGAAVIWLGLSLTALMGFGALAVDLGHVYVQENRLQFTADIAAAAAARALDGGDADEVKATAVDYARKNMPTALFGNVLKNDDVELGSWDGDSHTFTAGAADPNAVRVTLRRTRANNNAVNTFLAGQLGYSQMDIEVQAVAAEVANCYGAGIVAGGQVNAGQDVRLDSGLCVYGRGGVQFGQDPRFDPDSLVGALDISTIDSAVPDEHKVQADVQPTMANNIDSIISDLESGDPAKFPPQITQVQPVGSLPNPLVPGTAYVVSGSVNINQDYVATDVIIATRESISFGQDGRIRNSAGTCPTGGVALGLYAAKNIALGQDAEATGVQIVAGETITIGQDLRALAASIEAGKDVVLNQDPHLISCDSAYDVPGIGGLAGTRLVQ